MLAEPTQGLGRHRTGEKSDGIQFQNILYQLIIEFLTATIFDPAQQFIGAPTPTWSRTKQRGGGIFTVPVSSYVVSTIDHPAGNGSLNFCSFDHRTDIKIIDFQRTTGHLVNAIHKIECIFLENTTTPGTLEFQYHRLLCLGDHGETGRD